MSGIVYYLNKCDVREEELFVKYLWFSRIDFEITSRVRHESLKWSISDTHEKSVKRKRRRQEVDKVQATRGKKKIRVDEYAGWERTSVVGIVSCNKKLVGLKRKVCRLGMKLYEASIEKFFPNVCLLLRFSLCCYFHFSHRWYTLVCINKRISSLNEIRQTEKGFHLEGSKGK